MTPISRRAFLELAVAVGATAAFGQPSSTPSHVQWRERRDLFPEGVASGDPDHASVLLWTRRPALAGGMAVDRLHVEVAEDDAFTHVVARADAPVAAESDWTCRVLVGGLRPAREYWYRFTDADGNGSRIGRTITAPADDDERAVRFAFVSCQNVTQGAQNAYRRMIYEDERAAPADRLGFVLHLGDFIYEIVWYPEDRPQGMYDRRIRDVVRYTTGEKISDFHVPTTIDDYRAAYRGYLHDPDLQDARARWPFVNMWDNHEFSWLGWQGLQKFNGKNRPAQTKKVAANQAFFEYQPARMAKPSGPSFDRFDPPRVSDVPIEHFDDHGLGQEPNNLTAIRSLTGYRALRYGRHVDLIVTDQHSYRSEEPTDREETRAFTSSDFPELVPEEVMEILDGGRAYSGGHPPSTIRFAGRDVPNFRASEPPQTILGAEQKAWFLDRLHRSTATWKIWGNTIGTLDMRVDPQHLPQVRWPGAAYATFGGGGDYGTAFIERGEIYDFVRTHGITGFATVAGDRHSFWAGLASKALPPKSFDPVGVAFITGSISAPGLVEAYEHRFPKDHPLRPLFVGQGPADTGPRPIVNLLLRHGVRACREYLESGDLSKARALSDRQLAPHLSFVDMGGHGYAIVRATRDAIETEFVCIPRPLERSDRADGGPVRYRVRYRARLWGKDEKPALEGTVIEGAPVFSV